MQMSIGVEYALHSLFYMIGTPKGSTIGIKELAQLNNLSETYLSKIFTKLRKAGIVRSVQGVKGGYELAQDTINISFWDVVEAIEGSSYLFQCAEIRQNNILVDSKEPAPTCPCLIKIVMTNAENEMRKYLKEKTLAWLYDEMSTRFSDDKKSAISNWQNKVTNN
ncbi:MAG: RrF2 family transcriptional regulator [Cellulosilyticaceae bacterium]